MKWFLSVLVILFLSACAPTLDLDYQEICIEDCYKAYIADDDDEMRQGLMFVDYLPPDEGMIFIFPQTDTWGFWMKNTLIPLDIIWIDEFYTVVDVQTVQPCEQDPCEIYIPEQPALYVLELNADSGVQINDSVIFR